MSKKTSNPDDLFLKWKTEAKEILRSETTENLAKLTEEIGPTVRSNIQKDIVDKHLRYLYNQACEILYHRGYFLS